MQTRHPGSAASLPYIRVRKLLFMNEMKELLSSCEIQTMQRGTPDREPAADTESVCVGMQKKKHKTEP